MVTKLSQKQPEIKEYNNNLQQSRQEVFAAIQGELASSNHPNTISPKACTTWNPETFTGFTVIPYKSSGKWYDISPIDNSVILQEKIAKYLKPTEKQTEDAISTKSLNDDFSSKQRANYTRPSTPQSQSLFKKIVEATNKLIAVGAVFLGVCLIYHYCYTKGQINQSENTELGTIQLLKKEL